MSFSLDVSKFAEATGKKLEHVHNALSIDIFDRIILATPVDTGRLRGNWIPSKTSPNKLKRENLDRNGAEAMAEITKTFMGSKETKHYLTNNLPYAGIVEFGGYPNPPKTPELRTVPPGKTINGYSTQAPQGMVRVTLREFQRSMNKAISEARRIK